MDDNWCALFVAIQLNVSPELAFDMLERGNNLRYSRSITVDDIKNMISLKSQGYTYKEIGSKYGLSGEAAYRRIKRYKDRRESA